MEVNEQTLGVLKGLLTNVLSHDNAVRRNAESYLEQHEAQPGFPLLILTLITQLMAPITPQDIAIRQSASVLFKNVVKKHWVPEEDDKQGIVEQDKVLIRNNVVELMTTAPSDVQKQLAEAVTIISKHDFPQNWTNLLPQLTTMLSRQDIMVNKGVMLTANSIMKRFRYVFKSDALFEEILLCLQQFAVPLLQEFKRNGDLIVQLAGSIPQLEVLFETQRLIGRIYYSLNWQDIPEVFEDSATEWMTEFAKYLSYSNAVLVDNDEEHESGPIEKLQAAILENIALYANKYEEVFEPFLPQFTQLVWKLLMEVDTKPKYDILATSAIKFLTSVSSKQHNVGIFNENVLRDIVQQIVIKNLTATENDEELFEDNPIEYIRKDMEGSDQDSRRRCAMELVRALMKFFGPQISQLCQVYIDSLLQDYAKTKDWRCKDTALHLVLAVAIQSGTTTTGATELNPAINLMAIFDQHVLSELQQADVNHNEIVKADVIKVICVFRALLPSPMLLHVLPHLVRYLQSKHVVIQTYAAMCIERFLTIKESGSTTKNPLMKISKNDIIPHFQPLFGGLFAVLENPTLSENDYVMKCIMRALIVIGEDINAVLELVLSHLIKALEKVCKNPINPHYNHYLFECLALLVRSACGTGTTATMTDAQAAACSRFEVLLFPIFQQVLAMDVTEFVPYVFQILAQLLNARPANSGLSDAYRALFTPLLSPALWERKGNTPALVDLYKAYLSRGMKEIIAGNHLTGVLGVFQKLLSSKVSSFLLFALCSFLFDDVLRFDGFLYSPRRYMRSIS